MPEFKVTTPQGKQFKVTAPEGATQEDVLAKVSGLSNNRPLQNTALNPSINASPEQIENEFNTRIFEQDVVVPSGRLDAASRGFNLGVKEAVGGVAQRISEGVLKLNEKNTQDLIDDYLNGQIEPTEENLQKIMDAQARGQKIRRMLAIGEGNIKSSREQLRPSKEKYPFETIGGNVAGQVAAVPIPGGAGTTTLSKFGGALASGAASGFIQPTVDDESVLDNVLLGAGFSFGVQGISEAALPFVKRFINARQGKFRSEDFGDLLEQAQQEGIDVFHPDIANGSFLKKAGTLSEEVPVLGTVRERLRQNQQQKTAAQRLASEFGDNFENLDLEVQSSLKRQLDDFRQKAAQKFDNAAKLLDEQGEIPTDSFNATLERLIQAERDKGSIGSTEIINRLQSYIDAPRGNFSSTRMIRQVLGDDISDFYKGSDVIGRRGVESLQQAKNALENDLESFAENSGSREGLAAFKAANIFYRNNVVPFKEASLSSLIRTDEPEKVIRYLTQHRSSGGTTSRANKLFTALDEDGQEAVRGLLVRNALSRSMSGIDKFSPAKFSNELESIGNITGVFFKEADKKRIDGLAKIMRYTQRAGQVAENPPTGLRLLLPGGIGAAVLDPTATAATVGGYGLAFKALYNTDRGKKLLIAASDSSPASEGFENIMRRVNQLITREALISEN